MGQPKDLSLGHGLRLLPGHLLLTALHDNHDCPSVCLVGDDTLDSRQPHLHGPHDTDALLVILFQSRECSPVYALPSTGSLVFFFSLAEIEISPFSDQISQISRSVVSDSLRPHESQHARPPCPSPTPGVY